MATIQDIKTKLLNANELGRTNLAEQGVELSADATTYDIMQAIAEIVGSSGSGTEYTSIVYNTDNTITLTDKDGAIHTMSCTYEDGKLIGVTYGGKAVDLTYNGGALVKVGKTSVDMANAPATSGATFNIAYGETAPEDTSKLWIKANEPANVSVGSDIDVIESITTLNALPKSMTCISCARVGNKIYLFGGYNNGSFNTIYMFNTETEELTTLGTTLPDLRDSMGCVAVGTKIYLFGGKKGMSRTAAICIFNTETEEITTLATELPGYRVGIGCVAVGSKIYLFGGESERSPGKICMFNTETEELTQFEITLPSSCRYMGCAAIGTNIYIFGGQYAYGGKYLSDILVFNTTDTTIKTLSITLSSGGIQGISCVTIGDKIYLFGGLSSTNGYLSTISLFDPQTETLTPLATTLTVGRGYMGCSAVGNKVYLFGGYNSSLYENLPVGSPPLNIIEKFTLTHELAQGNIELQSGLLKNKFNLINSENAQIRIGVENVYIGNTNNEAELCEAYLHNGTEWVVIK